MGWYNLFQELEQKLQNNEIEVYFYESLNSEVLNKPTYGHFKFIEISLSFIFIIIGKTN